MKKTSPTFAVLGAGILGLTCAYTLTQRFGLNSVHIFDPKGFPAQNASFMAGGMLAPYSELDHMPSAYLPASTYSLEYWRNLSATIGAFELTENSSILLSHGPDSHLLSRFESILPTSSNWQKLDQKEIRALEPALPPGKFLRGLLMKTEGHLHPQKLMTALCNYLKNKHIQAKYPEELRNSFDWVIDCRGMGAAAEDKNLRGVKGETLIVRNTEFYLSRPVRLMHPRYSLYIVPRADNIFMVGATIIESENDDGILLRSGLELMSALYSLHPSFGESQILNFQSGIRPAYPDNLPRIHVKSQNIQCNGLYRHGYLLSPALAQCVLALVSEEKNTFTSLFLKDQPHGDYTQRTKAYAS